MLNVLIFYFRDYCPEHERLKKLQAEARDKDKSRQNDKFESDFDEENRLAGTSTQRRVSHQNEILLRNRAVGGDSSDEEDREGPRVEDEGMRQINNFDMKYLVNIVFTQPLLIADEEERMAYKSFRNYLEDQKKKQQSKSNSASS